MTNVDLDSFNSNVAQLFQEEGLSDIERLVATKNWETYPTFSRTDQIAFLHHLPPIDQTFVLFAFALRVLDNVLTFAHNKFAGAESDFIAFLLIEDWDLLYEPNPESPVPTIFICSNAKAMMDGRHLSWKARARETNIVLNWLVQLGEDQRLDVAEPEKLEDRGSFCVYVGPRQLPTPGPLTLRELSTLRK